MNQPHFFPVTWAMACVGVVVAAWVALLGDRPPTFLWTEVSAAWAQAVGSVAAIVAAIWIDRGSARRAEEREVRQARQQFDDARTAIADALRVLRNCRREFDHADGDSALVEMEEPSKWLRSAIEVLGYQIDQPRLAPGMLWALVTARRDLPEVLDAMVGYAKSGYHYHNLSYLLNSALGRLESVFEELDEGLLGRKPY